jgi:hypothetical protein
MYLLNINGERRSVDATGNVASFVIITAIVLLSVALDFAQECRAQNAIDARFSYSRISYTHPRQVDCKSELANATFHVPERQAA